MKFILKSIKTLTVFTKTGINNVLNHNLLQNSHLSMIYVLTNTSAQAGCDTKSVFKQRLIGLYSVCSFS